MDIIGGAFVVLGVGISIIAEIYILIKAFKKSLLWGFGSLLIPLVLLAFIILNWDSTKKFVFWIVIAIALFIIGGTLYNLR